MRINGSSSSAKMRKTTPSAPRATRAHSSPVQVTMKVRHRCKRESPVSSEPLAIARHSRVDDALGSSDSRQHSSNDTMDDSARCQATRNMATPQHRDEIVAAILTIASALGLGRDTLHLCVNVLDRFMDVESVESSRLETLSIAYVHCGLRPALSLLCAVHSSWSDTSVHVIRCLWLAVKFMETPATIEAKSIKKILQQRRHSGNVRRCFRSSTLRASCSCSCSHSPSLVCLCH